LIDLSYPLQQSTDLVLHFLAIARHFFANYEGQGQFREKKMDWGDLNPHHSGDITHKSSFSLFLLIINDFIHCLAEHTPSGNISRKTPFFL
jgi:hypothetical protein